MFMVDIGGMRCLYTGDYSRVTDRHLPAADMPQVTPHIGEAVTPADTVT
jgi:cleavage and polyadenylation specificity factor subunit 3